MTYQKIAMDEENLPMKGNGTDIGGFMLGSTVLAFKSLSEEQESLRDPGILHARSSEEREVRTAEELQRAHA